MPSYPSKRSALRFVLRVVLVIENGDVPVITELISYDEYLIFPVTSSGCSGVPCDIPK